MVATNILKDKKKTFLVTMWISILYCNKFYTENIYHTMFILKHKKKETQYIINYNSILYLLFVFKLFSYKEKFEVLTYLIFTIMFIVAYGLPTSRKVTLK